jgi:4-cresol dehydrogenase (hydroxylating) flavoprotein subunit
MHCPQDIGTVIAPADTAPPLAALRDWSAAIGADNVRYDDQTLRRYGRGTAPWTPLPVAVLTPASTAEVCQVVDVARSHQIPLHPISRGRNYGYGDAAPPTPGQAIVDLGRMNRILEVNTRLKYAIIEPGVTQQQLYQYLQANRTGLWMDATGAGLEASLVGNTLDRGFGHTRYGDHFATCCGMEVVLADGRVLETGFGHYANARATQVYRYGAGPFLDGLFAQSNYGIVTRIGLWLMPEPEAFCAFFCLAPDDKDLPDLIDRLADLRMAGLLQAAVHVGNDLRVISSRTRYPWDLAGGQTPLPADVREQLRRRYSVGAWNVGSAISGTRDTVAAARRHIARVLARYGPVFLDDRRLALAQRLVGLARRVGLCRGLAERLESIKPVYGLLKGIPTDEPLRGTGWRVRDAEPLAPVDPLECHAGLMWVSPAVPATGESAEEVMGLMGPIYHRHGFECLATFTLITERAMCCVSNIAFDQRIPEEVAAAGRCYDQLMTALMARGYIPYRAGPGGMARLSEGPSVFWDVARQVKRALDPHNIISPGRYVPPG